MIFTRPRYVNHPAGAAFKPQPRKVVPLIGPIFTGPIIEETIILSDEIIPGPASIYLPWIVLDPTSAGYYVW